ncbi:MAG: hypothetical protein PHW19_00670 [Salinivirgaceae bacterium]|nr:hypothetical protein [Salinivirgaceae bacterium]
MIIENTKQASKIKLFFMLIPVVFTASILALLLLEIPNYFWHVVALGTFMVIMFVVLSLLQFNYIHFEQTPQKILFRFYGIGPLNKKYQTFKINPPLFITHKIERDIFGLVPKLYLYVSIKNEIAKYPPISITGLSKNQRQQLINALTALETMNKKRT